MKNIALLIKQIEAFGLERRSFLSEWKQTLPEIIKQFQLKKKRHELCVCTRKTTIRKQETFFVSWFFRARRYDIVESEFCEVKNCEILS